MTRTKALGISERQKELIALIQDAKDLHFTPLIIQTYQKQLLIVQAELKIRKERRQQFKERKQNIHTQEIEPK